MGKHLAATESVSHTPVLVPTWRIHCHIAPCRCVFVGMSEKAVVASLTEHVKAKHTWPTHDASGNFVGTFGY